MIKKIKPQHMPIEFNQKIEWVDMLKVFKEEPIVIKGCLGFGLKQVAKCMKQHNMIKSDWTSYGSTNLDGSNAIIGAYKADLEAKSKGLTMNETSIIKEIERYNEIDCKVVGEITTYLREKHLN